MADQIYLFPIGFSKKSFKELEAQLDSYEIDVKLVERITPEISDNINALIIECDKKDLDKVENLCEYQELFPGLPIIGLSNSLIKQNKILSLKKPFNRNDFRSILSKLDGGKIELEYIPKAIRSVYSNQDSLLHYPIKNCFQDFLIKTWKLQKKVNQPMELVVLNKPVLVIYEDKVITLLSDERLQQLCTLTIYDHSISTTLLSISPIGLESIDATYFIAKVVLWSSCGRLPEGVNSTDIVRLVEPKKHYFLPAIAESDLIQNLWSIKNYSLQETERILDVQQIHLYSFFSVLYALDLIKVHPSAPSSVIKPKTNKKPPKQGWLGKLFLKKTNFSIQFPDYL